MNTIHYIGVDDAELQLFESQYALPDGMCYNSYLIEGNKIAIMDSVDARKADEWLYNVQQALRNRLPQYLILQHMEPDHSGSVNAFLKLYPQTIVVCSAKAQTLMTQFGIVPENIQLVKENDLLDLGGITLRFFMAPMVHWPEVMMTYCEQEQVLFSADAFGKFGIYHADKDDWACEARRYYFNICGKYGTPVTLALKKVASLPLQAICPLHGPVLEGEQMTEALRLYNIWSSYDVETPGVLIAHASIHGNTAKAAEKLAKMLQQRGIGKVAITDLCRDDMAEAIEDAFRYDRLVVAAPTYDGGLMPVMNDFIHHLAIKAYQNRTVAIIENGSWAPMAGKKMHEAFEAMKGITIVEPIVTIESTVKAKTIADLKALAAQLIEHA